MTAAGPTAGPAASPQLVLRAECWTDAAGRPRYRWPQLSIEPRALPALASDDIRLRMHYAGICGTDVHLVSADPVTGAIRTSAPVAIPATGRTIGHEGIGQVVEIGAAVCDIAVGDWVVPASVIACGTCPPCTAGHPNQCRDASLLGLEQDGLFGTWATLPARLAVVVNAAATDDAGRRALACLEPAGTALQACELAEIRASDTVVVFGAGPIGLFAAILARQVFGCASVTVVEPEPFRRRHAERWCDHSLSPQQYAAQPGRCDVLIEASGALRTVTEALPRLRARGRVVLLARSGEPLVIDTVDHLISEALTIRGCRGHLGGYLERILALHAAGRFPLDAAITSVHDGLPALLGLLQAPEAIVRDECKALVRLHDDTEARP